MKTFQQWLDRKPAGPAPRKRIAKVSKKRRGENAYYSRKRREFLARFKFCAVSPALFGRKAKSTEIHHRAGRIGANFLNEATWLPVCRAAHDWIHQHPSDARRRGWLI